MSTVAMAQADGPTFGELLRSHRLAVHLTQEELAERAQLSRRAIQELERGTRLRPRPATVVALADALELDPRSRASVEAAARWARTPGLSGRPPLNSRRELSMPLTSFVGRERELAEVSRLLEVARLVTLTGAGGIGKTRLALHVVQADANGQPGRVQFVDLSAIADASLVPQTIAASLGVREQPGHALVETLVKLLRALRMLLVLDNCEHVIDNCARLVEALLRACPHVSVLATSREALRVPGEMVWQVPPMSLPEAQARIDPDRLMQSEAVRLFVERAKAGRAGFALRLDNAPAIAEICRRLDGMPLAIELAAARVKVLSAGQIADHLADRFAVLTRSERGVPARHRTLGAAVDWSYELLGPVERVLFERLSVFAGGWTLEAAEAICRDALVSERPVEMLDRLTHLVEASLVIVEEHDRAVRYRQLETLRAYGSERLEVSESAETVRACHATYYLDLAEAMAQQADGPEHSAWMRLVETEYDNLRAALNWLAAHDAARALRLTVAIDRYWYLRGFVTEGCSSLKDLLSRVPERGKSWGRAALGMAELLNLRHDNPQACEYANRSMDVLRAAGDLGGTARAVRFLGLRALQTGDLGKARTLCHTSLALARQAGDQRETVVALDNLGLLAIAEQDLPEGRRRFEEGLALARSIGYRFGDVSAVARLGVIARLEGDYGRARTLIEEGLAFAEALGHRPAVCSYLTSLGNLARCEGDYAEARRLLLESLDSGQREVGLPLVLLNAVGSLGVLAIEEKAHEHGVRLLSAVSAAGAPRGTTQVPELVYDSDAALASARAALAESAYARAWAEGQAWSIDKAISQARAERQPPRAEASRRGHSVAASVTRTLSPRQRDVAVLVALGRTNRQIGEELVITEGTARVHVEHILAKLELHSRAQLAGWAVARGLVTPPT